jgi:hypothetical protein
LNTDSFFSESGYSYDVGLTSLNWVSTGITRLNHPDDLYTNMAMQEKKKLCMHYTEIFGQKTLIFNNGINTSLYVYETFREAGYAIRHR